MCSPSSFCGWPCPVTGHGVHHDMACPSFVTAGGGHDALRPHLHAASALICPIYHLSSQVVAMTAFILISMLLLPSVLTWIFYQLPVVGGRALMMEKLRCV